MNLSLASGLYSLSAVKAVVVAFVSEAVFLVVFLVVVFFVAFPDVIISAPSGIVYKVVVVEKVARISGSGSSSSE